MLIGFLLIVVFVVNFAYNRFQQVLQRNNAGSAAVFVHHYGQMDFLLLELFQQVRRINRLRHINHRPQEIQQVLALTQEITGAYYEYQSTNVGALMSGYIDGMDGYEDFDEVLKDAEGMLKLYLTE